MGRGNNMETSKSKAVLLMLLAELSFSAMQLFVKLSSVEVGTFEQVFFRNLVSLFIAGFIVKRDHLKVTEEIRRGKWAIWGRSLFGFLGILFFFYAANNARQANVAMLNRASPVFVMLFSAIFLKEKITRVKIAAIALCFLGAYIAMQPSFDSNPIPLFSAFLAAAAAGAAYTMLSYCKNLMHPSAVVFHFSAFSTVCAGIMMLPTAVWPSPKVFVMLMLIGIFAAAGQFLLTFSYQLALASEVSIYQYSGVVFTALLSFIVFKESLNFSSLLGGLIILIAIYGVFRIQGGQGKF